MRLISSAIGIIIVAFCPNQTYASEHDTVQALEHSAMASAHGKDEHAVFLLKHAEEGLKHAEAAENEHAEAHENITGRY